MLISADHLNQFLCNPGLLLEGFCCTIFIYAAATIRSHAGKGNGVFKSTFCHDFLLEASSGLWAPLFYRCGRIDTTPQAHMELQQ